MSKSKSQIVEQEGVRKRTPSRYLKVVRQGNTRTLALGSYLPAHWVIVEVISVIADENLAVIRLRRM